MKYSRITLSRCIKDESGGVLILVALLMVVLLGVTALVVDVGALYQARRQMVNAADAAALAGAQELIFNPGNVDAVARDYAIRLNGSDNDKVQVIPTTNTVTVVTGKNVLYTFAKAAGFGESSDVSARATALIYNPVGVQRLVPFTLPLYDWKVGVVYTLVHKSWKDGPLESGNYGLLDFDKTFKDKGTEYPKNIGLEDLIKYGCPVVVSIGDEIETDPGQNTGPVNKGVEWRIENSPVVIVPIYDEPAIDAQGRGEVKIIAFAAFELIESDDKHEIKGKFVNLLVEGAYGGSDIPDYGVKSITLIE